MCVCVFFFFAASWACMRCFLPLLVAFRQRLLVLRGLHYNETRLLVFGSLRHRKSELLSFEFSILREKIAL